MQVSAGVTSVTASPNPFVPTGSNSTTITVQATPGQTGLTCAAVHAGQRQYRLLVRPRLQLRTLPLTETSPGVYTLQWNAVQRPVCSAVRT